MATAHTIPPHEVNYRANLWALKDHGVDRVVSVATVGGIHPDLIPGMLVMSPIRSSTTSHGRAATYFVESDKPVTHLDFTFPYCDAMRRRPCCRLRPAPASACATAAFMARRRDPRLETAAEINRMERDGADMVGHDGCRKPIWHANCRSVTPPWRGGELCGRARPVGGRHPDGRNPGGAGEVMLQVRHLLEQLVTNDSAGLCQF